MKWIVLGISIVIHCLPAYANNQVPVNHPTQTKSTTNALFNNSNWFITLNGGAEFPTEHHHFYVKNGSGFPSPFDIDIYTASELNSRPFINLTLGRRWTRVSSWIPAYSLGLLYQHSFLGTIKGNVIQNSIPAFENYSYNWDLSSDILLVSTKINLYNYKKLSPFLSLGLGGARNRTHYNEQALPGVTARLSPNFSSHNTQFAFNAGIGLDYQITPQFFMNLGYLYQNLGSIVGDGKGTWSGTSLDYGTYKSNGVFLGFGYLFEKQLGHPAVRSMK